MNLRVRQRYTGRVGGRKRHWGNDNYTLISKNKNIKQNKMIMNVAKW